MTGIDCCGAPDEFTEVISVESFCETEKERMPIIPETNYSVTTRVTNSLRNSFKQNSSNNSIKKKSRKNSIEKSSSRNSFEKKTGGSLSLV
jgi:hypothetical protein